MEWIKDFALWAVGVVGAVVAYLFSKIHDHGTRIAMLERTVNDIPADMIEIKLAIADMRREGRERSAKLYEHIDKVRLEFKADLRDKANRQ